MSAAPNLSPPSVFRQNLRRTLEMTSAYHIRQMASAWRATFYSTIGIALCLWFGYRVQAFSQPVLCAVLFVMVGGFFALGWWFRRPYKSVSVHVAPTQLTLEIDGQKTLIEYTQLLSMNLAYFKGGFEIQLQTMTGTTLRFGRGVERLDYVLDSVSAARPELFDVNHLANMRGLLVASDHSLARRNERAMMRGRSFYEGYGILLLAYAIGVFEKWMPQQPIDISISDITLLAVLHFFMGVILSECEYLGWTYYLRERLKTQPQNFLRSKDAEMRIWNIRLLLHTALSIAMAIYLWG